MKLQNNLQIEQLLNTDWANQFNRNQLYRIREGLNHNLDVSIYAKTTLAAEHMREIVKGLKLGFDMTKYTSGEYTENQLRQIVFGLEKGLDVSEFDDVSMSSEQMSTAQEFMKLGFDMTSCAKESVTVQEIRREIRRRIWLIEYDVSTEVRNAYFEYVDLIGE